MIYWDDAGQIWVVCARICHELWTPLRVELASLVEACFDCEILNQPDFNVTQSIKRFNPSVAKCEFFRFVTCCVTSQPSLRSSVPLVNRGNNNSCDNKTEKRFMRINEKFVIKKLRKLLNLLHRVFFSAVCRFADKSRATHDYWKKANLISLPWLALQFAVSTCVCNFTT